MRLGATTSREVSPTWDLFLLAVRALLAHRLRSALSMLGIAIGIASVVLLTSVGEGTRRFLVSQFAQFGTDVVNLTPGKSKTIGIPGVLGGTTHPLDLDDMLAISLLPEIESIIPVVVGQARVEAGSRGRSVILYGTTPDLPVVFDSLSLRRGSFWREQDPRRQVAEAVLGATLERELFDQRSGLGEFVTIGGRRFRIVGVLAPSGQLLGMDLGDTVYIPAASALSIFDMQEVTEFDFRCSGSAGSERGVEAVRRLLISRHGGEEDFTILTQEAMLKVFGNVMDVITMSVGAIGGISLLVGAIGILTMMWITVGERVAEIGLLRALGARRSQIQQVFLFEAVALGVLGGLLGLGFGLGVCALLRALVDGLPIAVPMSYAMLGLATSLIVGLLAGVFPARRAAALDPATALRAE